MVQQKELKVALVEAKSKTPFKEHVHEGKVYVEVEPDAEYFISVEKTSKTKTDLWLDLYVDGKKLDYHFYFGKDQTDHFIYGSRVVHPDGSSHYVSFKFVKPKQVDVGDGDGETFAKKLPCLGSVRLDVYELERIKVPPKQTQTTRSSGNGTFQSQTFAAGSVEVSDHNVKLSKKKVLRSETGTVFTAKKERATTSKKRSSIVAASSKRVAKTESESMEEPVEYTYKRGSHLDKFTLHYCAAVGLVEAGVFERPKDPYEYHRMVTNFERGAKKVKLTHSDHAKNYIDISESDDESSVVCWNEKPAAKKKRGNQEDSNISESDDMSSVAKEHYFECKAKTEKEKAKKLCIENEREIAKNRIENAREIAKNRMEWKAKGMSDADIDKLFPIN